MKADKKAEKRKRQRENKNKKLADKRTQRILNYTIIIVLSIVCTISYCKKQKAMEMSDITICKVIDVYQRPGRHSSKLAVVEYYVSGKRFEDEVFLNSKYSDGVGDCFLLKYSVSDPDYCDVLWDRGKQDCGCLE